jgi:5-methyltetrahydrofolate--homocysteine methyltransferase
MNIENWNEKKQRLIKWWNREDTGRAVILATVPKQNVVQDSGMGGWDIINNTDNFNVAIDRFDQWCDQTCFVAEAVPNLIINFGAGSVAAYVGANVIVKPETVWFNSNMSWDEIISNLKYDPNNKWWQLTKEATIIAADRLKNKYFVTYPDLGGTLDILASLRGSEQLLVDMIDSPDQVKYCCNKLDELWCRYYDETDNILKKSQEGSISCSGIWGAKKNSILQCDFSAMISPQMFEEFVLPSLITQCGFLEHSIYHVDGPGELPHIDMLLSISKLTGLQWIPGAPGVYPDGSSSEKWYPMYKKILKAGKILDLAFVEFDKIETVIKNIGHKGVLINAYGDYTESQARNLINSLTY